MSYVTLTVYRHFDDAEVEIEAEYEVIKDADPHNIGEGVVWHEYVEFETTHVYYKCNGQTYVPTGKEWVAWNKEINLACENDYQQRTQYE